ncbi:hypothetical protein [Haloplanus pelagicus]|uniref:hypothetical protein n=1 Tax=Haloplanus pelagicus TaxID=2949995 RepID=UPI00203A4770|nr:hypothetical protein [Haloplanus sp. HW8-1]
MALRLGQALGRGARRAFSVSGIVALVLTICYQVLLVGSLNTVIVNRLPSSVESGDIDTIGFTLPLPTEVAAALGLVAFLLGIVVVVVAARLLTRDLPALSSLPGDLFTRRLGRAFLSTLVVSVVLAVVIPLGFVLLFFPGLFLTVSLQFAVFAVAVEDTGPVDALRRSWELASGNRWRLLALSFCLPFSAASVVPSARCSPSSRRRPVSSLLSPSIRCSSS